MNNKKIGIVVDSTFKLDKDFQEKEAIEVVYLDIIVDNQVFKDGEVSNETIYEAMSRNKKVTTTQPTPARFKDAFDKLLNEGYEHVICLTISASLSGTNNSANLAKSMLDDPTRVTVIDTRTAICGSEYIAESLVQLRSQETEINVILEKLEQKMAQGSVIFTVDDLGILVKSGRLSKLSGMIGNLLKIKPILRFDQGKLEVEHKVRSSDNVIKYLVQEVGKLQEKAKTIVKIAYTTTSDLGLQLEKEIKAKFNDVKVSFSGKISAVVAVHVGSAGLGIYLTNE